MTDLIIPDAAHEAGEKGVMTLWVATSDDAYQIASDVLHSAAPLIVAAELRRLADVLDERRRAMRTEAVDVLRARADELDPGGGRDGFNS